MKKKKPKFIRWMSASLRRIKPAWRRPKGINSKVFLKKKGKLPMPAIGYGTPKAERFLHPSGMYEVLVHNVRELENASGKAVRIASTVGNRKRSDILKRSEELKLKVLNP